MRRWWCTRCGEFSDEERALPEPLRVDIEYSYEARHGDNIDGTVDYGAVIGNVVGALEARRVPAAGDGSAKGRGALAG